MTNKEAIEYASQHSFQELYELGVQDGKNEAILKQCNHDLAVKEAYEHGLNQNYDDMASAVGLFIAQCGEMAEKNWLPSQVDMLERLFGAVLKGCEYDEWVKSDDK